MAEGSAGNAPKGCANASPCDWGFASLLLSCEVACGCGGGVVAPTPPEGGATSRPLGQVKHRCVGKYNTDVR